MKVVAIGSGLCAIAFVAMGLQMGIFQGGRIRGNETGAVEERPVAPTAKFPEDLAPAASAKPVPAAAEYKPGPDVHPLVFVRVGGTIHPWQENLREDWQAESVSTTQLVVVVGTPKKLAVDTYHYPGGAPPITRYIFEVEISVIEAKTGKILANRLFRNVPRSIAKTEAWETTAIGRIVSMQQIFNWVSRTSKAGFPEAHDPTPITLQVD
jgi:hypothetical protein